MKIAFHTLGCKVNQYETQALIEIFYDKGYQIVDEYEEADIYVVNTCSVTNLADRKSRQYIRKVRSVRPDCLIAVVGCYAQLKPEEVAAIDGVEIVLGTNQKHMLAERIEQYLDTGNGCISALKYDELDEFIELSTNTSMGKRSRAYVKVQEGCNRFCSYCVIPYARGSCRSRDRLSIIKEATGLINEGFEEIILTGINTALCNCLDDVIDDLNSVDGSFRIRLSSLEPTVVDAKFVEGLLKYEKLCHHLHLSLQSASDGVLKRMNRRYTRKEYKDIVNTLFEFDRCYGVTTDIIVGFPGESEEEFEETLSILKEIDFCKVHLFKYSPREGTPAASMANQITGDVKKKRMDILVEEAERSCNRFINRNIGTVNTVLFEEVLQEEGIMVGYTDNYIRAYMSLECDNSEMFIGRLTEVEIIRPYLDGVFVKKRRKI